MKKELIKLANYLNKADLTNEALFIYNIAKKSSYTNIDDIPQSLLKSYTESHKNIKEQVEGPMKEESNFHEFSEDDLGRAHMSAMSRKSASAPTKYLLDNELINGTVLDYGCGKGKDAEALEERGFNVEKYDPVHHPVIPTGKFDTIICNYVLNVVEEGVNRGKVLYNIRSLLNDGGAAYISVRNDLKDDVVKVKGYNQYRVSLPEGSYQNKLADLTSPQIKQLIHFSIRDKNEALELEKKIIFLLYYCIIRKQEEKCNDLKSIIKGLEEEVGKFELIKKTSAFKMYKYTK